MFLITIILYAEISKIYYFCTVNKHYNQTKSPETKCYQCLFH